MLYPIAIHKDENSVFGVTVPDIPGCFSYGDTIEDAIKNTHDAIVGHVDTMLELGLDLEIKTTDIENLKDDEDYTSAIWAYVDVDLSKMTKKPERFNVSWPSFVLSKVDAYINERHENRSGFLARAALELINKETHHHA